MTDHPIKDIYQDSVSPIKGNIRDYEKLFFPAANVSDVQSRDLTGTLYVLLLVADGSAVLFGYDPSDTSTAHDGTTVLKDASVNRFKKTGIVAVDLTAAVINAALGAGGLDFASLPGSAQNKIMMRLAAGGWVDGGVVDLVGLIDSYLGSTVWRDAVINSGGAGTVAAFPRNSEWRTGGRGYLNSAAIFDDGTVGACGYGAESMSPDGSGSNIGRFMKIPFADGVDRTVVKLWAGGASCPLYCKTDDNLVWAFGRNGNGQLGIGSTTHQTAGWVEIDYFRLNSLEVEEIYTSLCGLHAWFRLTNGHLYATGYNATGVLGDASTTQRTSPVRCGTLTGVTDVFPGEHTNGGSNTIVGAIAGGTLYAWGYNGAHNLGLGDLTQRTSPISTGLIDVTKARFGAASLALKSDGTLWSCGYNGEGGPCQGTFAAETNSWTQIASLGSAVLDFEANTGRYVMGAAIITVAGVGRYLRTWGYNAQGAHGTGNTTNQNTIQTPTGSWQGSVDEVAFLGGGATGYNGCFIRVGNALHAAGYNVNANLSIGGVANANTFTPVLGLRGAIIDWWVRGYDQYCGLMVLTDEACLSGGYNGHGQTGTHEASLHNLSSLQEIIVGGNIKGDDGAPGVLTGSETIVTSIDANDYLFVQLAAGGYRRIKFSDL